MPKASSTVKRLPFVWQMPSCAKANQCLGKLPAAQLSGLFQLKRETEMRRGEKEMEMKRWRWSCVKRWSKRRSNQDVSHKNTWQFVCNTFYASTNNHPSLSFSFFILAPFKPHSLPVFLFLCARLHCDTHASTKYILYIYSYMYLLLYLPFLAA